MVFVKMYHLSAVVGYSSITIFWCQNQTASEHLRSKGTGKGKFIISLHFAGYRYKMLELGVIHIY